MFPLATARLLTAPRPGPDPTLEGAAPLARPLRFAAAVTAEGSGPSGRGLRRDSVGWRDPFRRQRARHGRGAGFRWWHRLGAGLGLAVLIGVLGVLLAALVGLGAFLGGIALETLIG